MEYYFSKHKKGAPDRPSHKSRNASVKYRYSESERRDDSIIEFIREYGDDLLTDKHDPDQYGMYRVFCERYDYAYYSYRDFVSRMDDVYIMAPGYTWEPEYIGFKR